MKKLLFVPAIALVCCLSSCDTNKGGVSAAAQKNLDAMHGVSKCFETKDFSKLGDYLAEDAVDHAGEQGDVKGLANLKTQFEKWAASTENDKTEVIKELADDEYVMSWLRFTGTSKVDQMGMKAGQPYNMTSMEVAKFKDGKAVEHWTFMDGAEMMKMMSSMQMPAPTPDSTATKK